MQLKYVGPKPHISHHGISFDNNKEDKYVYLNIVVQLLHALNHDYFEDKTYIYTASTTRIENQQLMGELLKFCPHMYQLIDKESIDVADEIQENITRAKHNKILTQDDKEALTNNLELMHDYLIQRAVNKRIYYCAIEALASLLQKDHIDHIITPMFQKFVHVLHSVQGVLRKEKLPIDTQLDIYDKDGSLVVKLQVINT